MTFLMLPASRAEHQVCLASRRQDQSHYWSILLTCAVGIAHIESVCRSVLESSRSGETCDVCSMSSVTVSFSQ